MKIGRKWIHITTVCLSALCLCLLSGDVHAANANFNQKPLIQLDGNEEAWIKYKAKNNGYITVTAIAGDAGDDADSDSSTEQSPVGTFQLCNAKKAALSKPFSYNASSGLSADASLTFGVKKNAVYYLRVAPQGSLSVQCKFKKVTENSGSAKSKAKLVKQNKKIGGIIIAGDKTADWYKLTVAKKQILHLYFSGKTNEKIRFTFSGTYIKTAKRYIIQGDESQRHTYSTERVQPGTYYVKVERFNDSSSGYYSFQWK